MQLYPSVMRLQIHLPNMHTVCFREDETVAFVLANNPAPRTMLTEFFRTNSTDLEARRYLYKEFPQHYKWINYT